MADIQPYRFVVNKHDFVDGGPNPLKCAECGRSPGFVMHRKPKK